MALRLPRLSLKRLLGLGPLRPPRGVRKNQGNPWSLPIPKALPDGSPIEGKGPEMAEIEDISPPELKTASCRKGSHWHSFPASLPEGTAAPVHYHHQAGAWGRWSQGRWSWLEREGGRWWIWGSREGPSLVWHQKHWWWETREGWLLLHQGRPWGWGYLRRWRSEGFSSPEGVEILYSADGSRLLLVLPGQGGLLLDSAGRLLASLREEELPPSLKAKAPSSLILPR